MDFKPHLLLKILVTDDRLTTSLLDQNKVLLAYNGKWCAFRYTLLDLPEESSFMKLHIELNNGFLHYGQFSSGQQVQLYHAGAPITTGIIEEVLDPCFEHWSENQLSTGLIQKEWLPKSMIQPLVADWIEKLSIHPTIISFDGDSVAGYQLALKNVPHNTLLLSQAQQICKTISSSSLNCCYKISYTPLAYGLIDLFLKELSLTFVLHDSTHFTKGRIIIN